MFLAGGWVDGWMDVEDAKYLDRKVFSNDKK